MPVTVKRNAYGRQLGSFHTEAVVEGIGEVPMTFIRAPYVAEAGTEKGVQVLATVEDRIVAVSIKTSLLWHFTRNWMRVMRSIRRFWECVKEIFKRVPEKYVKNRQENV